MTIRGDHTDAREFIARDEIDELFGRASPNIERHGCPSSDVLAHLSRRVRPIDDSAYAHLGQCSPCYREFRTLQEAAALVPPSGVTVGARWVAAAAIIAIVITAGLWFAWSRQNASTGSGQVVQGLPSPVQVQATLDLRPFTIARSPQDPVSTPSLVLPRAKFVATILLPVGAEPGAYEVEIRDSASRRLTAATAEARLLDFVATLEPTLDLHAAPSGSCQVAVRRTGDDWRVFPAVVR